MNAAISCGLALVVMATVTCSDVSEVAGLEVAPLGDCRLRRILHTMRVQNCRPRRVVSAACQGSCHSYSQVAPDKDAHMQRFCNCCQEVAHVPRTIGIFCRTRSASGGSIRQKRLLRTHLPTQCMCRPCSAGVGIQPLELADISDKRNIWDESPL